MSNSHRRTAHGRSRRWRLLLGGGKLLLAVGILAFLFYRLRGEDAFHRWLHEPKHWGRLAAAQALVLAAICNNYTRWWMLGRALKLNFHLRDAFRLGSLGLLLNQVAPGSVGGDLFKAVAVAREQHGKRTEAVASVVVDRVVGLYAMLLVASAGYLFGAADEGLGRMVHGLARAVIVLGLIGTIGLGLLMWPAFTGPAVRGWAARLPVVGETLDRLIGAAAAYRTRRRYLFIAITMSCVTHMLFVTSFWLIGTGLPMDAPTLATTFVIGPLSLAAGAIPLTPSGLGTFEAAMDELYRAVGCRRGDGLLVAVNYRLMTYVMAAVGAVYYLAARKRFRDIMAESAEPGPASGMRQSPP
ncbi:MAG: hypothetical protein DCC67_07015 [Planctomycetota bacterium]|nr:MAG: hypothetical protein DCC67_07015 [Planctomycetota bacterium]